MHIHPLTDQVSVSAQITVDDVAAIAAQGFRSIINNRPDGEAPDQPASTAMQAAAHQAGLAYLHMPVISGQVNEVEAERFADALRQMPVPVLAFCRSGTRSCVLWALKAEGPADAIVAVAGQAGYDLSCLRPRLGQGGRTDQSPK